ncbi:MAG: hypothetical protein Q8P01_04700 [bacterium]|nr:hypothetical protein [bacterium]
MKESLGLLLSALKKGFRPKGAPFYVFLAILFAFLVIFSSRFFATRGEQTRIPEAFLQARESAALVSRDIVALTGSTNEKIRAVNLLDVQGDAESVERATSLLREAKNSNEEALSRAFELSEHLRALAQSLAGVSPLSSQRVAYEAIAIELSLVSEFITYTKNLNAFLESLERSIARRSTFQEQDALSNALRDVNENTKTINRLNNEFLARVREFDKSL